jgi:hypothetical protein
MRRLLFGCFLFALALPTGAQAEFGFKAGVQGFSAAVVAEGGAPATLAGSHPYRLDLSVAFEEEESPSQPGTSFPDGDLRDLSIDLPPGMLANPSILPTCTVTAFHAPRNSPFEVSRSGESCSDRTQVGTLEVESSLGERRFGLFNLEAAPGRAAQLGASPYGAPVAFDVVVRPSADGTYALALAVANFPQSLDVSGLSLSLWGVPWALSHSSERGNCLNEQEPSFPWAKCSVGPPANNKPLAYLTLPTLCGAPISFAASATSWQQAGQASASAHNLDPSDKALPITGCAGLGFKPLPEGNLTDKMASSPSGFNFRLENESDALIDPTQRIPAQVNSVVVGLPSGVTVNPSVGAGLGACTPAQYAAETAQGPEGSGCPNAAKIGDFEVITPLFSERLRGAVYLASPYQNPSGNLVAVYLVARSSGRGILVKLAGKIDPNQATGTLTATFDGLPQLPYTDLDLTFRTGQRSFLITPASCGQATTQIEMAPWGGILGNAHATTASQITAGIGGGPCPFGTPPFSPGAIAGGINSNVGSYTPYFVHLTRQDTEQEITSYSLILPKGITGKLAGIPFCPESAIQAARTNSGFAETASPSCPAASHVGRTLSGYGVGAALTYAPGRIYLAGPYNGQPLSLVTVNSATVGPFDLGTIVIRSAFAVDRHTAQLQIDSTASDPIPHILAGIPLHLREVRIYMDRYQFTHNPSSCEPSQLISTLEGAGARFDDSGDDSTATVAKHFQLLNCLTLGFRPKLGLRLRGGSRRGDYPSLRATFASRGAQDSNLKQIEVTMPHSLFLAQNHIRSVCTRVQFDQERCPSGSVYGKAVAYTPLFDEPLRGDVFLRSSTNRLPDLVASLRSGEVRITLEGKIGPARHGIRARFEELPDAPIERFVMTLSGGKQGLLINSQNICADPPLASVKGLAQNNLGAVFTSELRGQCEKRKGKSKGRGGRK